MSKRRSIIRAVIAAWMVQLLIVMPAHAQAVGDSQRAYVGSLAVPSRFDRAPSRAQPRASAGPVESAVPEVADLDDGYDVAVDSPKAIRARHFVRSGVALIVSGIVLGLGAVALAMTDPCEPLAGNSCQELAHGRAVITMSVPAGGFLVGGIAMVTYGAARQRRLQVGGTAGRFGGTVAMRYSF